MIASYLFLHLLCACVRLFCWHFSPFLLQSFFPRLQLKNVKRQRKREIFMHAYTHFDWSFEVVSNYASFFAVSLSAGLLLFIEWTNRCDFFSVAQRLLVNVVLIVISSILLDFEIPIVWAVFFFFCSFVNINNGWEAWMRAEFQSHHSIGSARMFGDYTKGILIIACILIHHLVLFTLPMWERDQNNNMNFQLRAQYIHQ